MVVPITFLNLLRSEERHDRGEVSQDVLHGRGKGSPKENERRNYLSEATESMTPWTGA